MKRRAKNHGKRWTPEDDAYLEDMYGTYDTLQLARKLGRSRSAVIRRVETMGLGRMGENSEWMHFDAVLTALYGGNRGGYERRRLQKMGFPVHEKQYGEKRRTFYVVYASEMWQWLEKNRRVISFARFEENILGAEPAWVKEKRRIDIDEALNGKKGGHNASWEPWEDEKLRRMLKNGTTMRNAAKELRKKERALIVRRSLLGIDEHFIREPARPWTDSDVETLLECYEKGMSWRQIGNILDRGAWTCEQKYKKLQNPGYFQANNYHEKKHINYRGGAASAAETREIMFLHSIKALNGFENAPEIDGSCFENRID